MMKCVAIKLLPNYLLFCSSEVSHGTDLYFKIATDVFYKIPPAQEESLKLMEFSHLIKLIACAVMSMKKQATGASCYFLYKAYHCTSKNDIPCLLQI